MPALDDSHSLPPIGRAPGVVGRPIHPSPTRDGLALEVLSPRELAYHGHQFAIDQPVLMYPLGWGEYEYIYGGDQ